MLRTCRVVLRSWLIFSVAFVWGGQAASAEDSPQKTTDDVGQVAGMLTDSQGRAVMAGRVAVFICDAATGMPIHRESKRPISPSVGDPHLSKLWVVDSDDRGSFEFLDVPAGKYRIVAQSWSGTEGFPGFDATRRPSAFLILHGIAEEVEVKASQRSVAHVKQLGNHVLRIVNDPEEPHALLLISLKPTLGDGILGPYGWGKEFCRNLIGVTQMEVPHVTIAGLPEGAAVHAALMNYDNNPGAGAASYAPGQREGRLRIVASWSNSHKEPPPELVKLTDHLEANKITLFSFLDTPEAETISEGDARRAMFAMLAKDNYRQVTVDGLGQQKLADVLAAYGYIRLRKSKQQ